MRQRVVPSFVSDELFKCWEEREVVECTVLQSPCRFAVEKNYIRARFAVGIGQSLKHANRYMGLTIEREREMGLKITVGEIS